MRGKRSYRNTSQSWKSRKSDPQLPLLYGGVQKVPQMDSRQSQGSKGKGIYMRYGKKIVQPGDYTFEVLTVSPEVSKAGNNMLKIVVLVLDGTDKVPVRDWIVESNQKRFGAFMAAIGQDNWQWEDCRDMQKDRFKGQRGKCRVKIQEAEGEWPEQNRITSYFAPRPVRKEVSLYDPEIGF